MRSAEILEEVQTLLEASEFEVVDVTTAGSKRGLVVRVFVDKKDGVSLEDCARVSRALGDHFEAHGTFRNRYVLEVSSPGVDRPLRLPEHFQRFLGETAQVTTHEKIDGRHNHVGVLAAYDAERDEMTLELADGGSLVIPRGAVKKAHLKRDPWERPPGRPEA
jgi:ribosome maturation factor RimP